MAHFLYGIAVVKNLECLGMICTPIWGVELQCYAGDCVGGGAGEKINWPQSSLCPIRPWFDTGYRIRSARN
jgi:hypothetical protein